jgi:enoyl-CoA hydratase/carnithine racemase
VLTGKLIGAEEAERIGLVNRVVPADGLAEAVDALAGELLACAPIAVGLAKRVLDASARPALSTTLELEVALQEICARSEDFAEGARAFKERRQPEFSGR